MNKEQLMTVLQSPVVSEKSSRVADRNRQYTFRVRPDASKPQIRKAVELMFEVPVASVQVTSVKGKMKRQGAIKGRRAGWKKAYVTLKPGHDIDFSSGG